MNLPFGGANGEGESSWGASRNSIEWRYIADCDSGFTVLFAAVLKFELTKNFQTIFRTFRLFCPVLRNLFVVIGRTLNVADVRSQVSRWAVAKVPTANSVFGLCDDFAELLS